MTVAAAAATAVRKFRHLDSSLMRETSGGQFDKISMEWIQVSVVSELVHDIGQIEKFSYKRKAPLSSLK